MSISNNKGFYQQYVNGKQVNLKVSYTGFEVLVYSFDISRDTIVNFYLVPVLLDEVIVSDQSLSINTSNTIAVPMKQVEALYSLAGEVDIMKALTLFPGISPTIEGHAGINVRGGSPDQNLILLDDAPVYNVSHLFGFVSIFNADAIKNVEILKGAFPARYGGRLSSVIDISMKEGNKKEFGGEVTAGFISSKLTLEIPLKKDRTSLMISGRSAYPDLLTFPQRIGYENGDKDVLINYSMWDANIKIHHRLSENGSLSVSHYSGRDGYIDKYREAEYKTQESSLNWGNITNTFRYNQILSKKLFVEAIAYHTRYQYENVKETNLNQDGVNQRLLISSKSSLQDFSGKTTLSYQMNGKNQLNGGVHYVFHQYNPSINGLSNNIDGEASNINLAKDVRSSANEAALFIEDEWQITKKLRSNIGLRYSTFFLADQTFSGLEPRTSFDYELTPKLSMNVSYSYMRQYIHLLTSSTVSLSNDIWVPVTELAPPQTSWISTLGLNAKLNKTYHGSLELFYKQMDNLIDYQEGVNPTSGFNENWDQLIESGGTGQAYGAEFFFQKNEGKVTGWVSYTLSWTNRQFENINEGRRYPYRYDRRHHLSLVGNYKLNDKWSFSSNWVFMSGYAVTAPVALYFSDRNIVAYGERNNARMPSYHRLDIAFNRTKTTKNNNQSTWSFGVYNTYMRKNPLYLETSISGRTTDPQRGIQIFTNIHGPAFFLFVPSISYSWKF